MKKALLFGFCLSILILLAAGTVISARPAPAASGTTQRWLISVKPGFSLSDVTAIGGTCLWYWEGAGIAAVDSANPNFGDLAKGNTIDFAVADVAAKPPKRLSLPKTAGSPPPLFDAYASGYQWYWQAIGAVRYDAFNQPVWQLGDYTGSGVKIADIDTGAPSVWLAFDANGNPTAFDLHPEFNEYDPLHPDLGGVVLIRDPNTGQVINFDADSHGTAVCSTIGAQHTGEGAIRGLAPKATLYCPYIDWSQFPSSFIKAWYDAAEFGCQILNNSWYDVELPVDRYADLQVKIPKLFRNAVTELHRRGVLIVAAASNDAIDPNKDGDTYYIYAWGKWFDNQAGYPAFKLIPQDMPNVIVAGGTGPADYDPTAPDLSKYDPLPGGQKGRAFNLDRSVSCYFPPELEGPWALGSDYGTFLTVVAPMGYNIKDWNAPTQNLQYQLMFLANPWDLGLGWGLHTWRAGTSFSSPITCGVAALAAEAYFRVHGVMPSPTTLISIIKASADDMVGPATDDFAIWNHRTLQFELQANVTADKPGKDVRYGYGRVNVVKAIQLAQK